MEYLQVTKETADYVFSDQQNLVAETAKKIQEAMPEDMRLAMAAGVRVGITASFEGGKLIIKAKTEYPVSILKTLDGKPINILVDRSRPYKL